MTANLLELAIEIAARAHAGQTDKSGQPYIFHPLRVMMRLQPEGGMKYEFFQSMRIVAVLHDVLEDTSVTEADLVMSGFGPEIIDALKALSRIVDPHKEIYLTEFIPRIAKNPMARIVKLADLADNMDPKRVPPGQEGAIHESQIRKYQKAKAYIEKVIELEKAEKLVKKLKEEIG